MYGTERMSMDATCRREFISRCCKWMISFLVILCWWFTSYALFSPEYAIIRKAHNEGAGKIYCMNIFDLENSQIRSIEFHSSYFSQLIMRTTVMYQNIFPKIHFGLDTVFIPEFEEYEDTGISRSIVPFSMVGRMGVNLDLIDSLHLTLDGYGGIETVGEYPIKFSSGIYGDATFWIDKWLFGGVLIALNEFHSLFEFHSYASWMLEIGMGIELSGVGLLAAFNLESPYKVLKLGTYFKVNPSFIALIGGNYSLEYAGWNITSGAVFNQLNLFGAMSSLSSAISYNLITGISINFSLDLYFQTIMKEEIKI